VKLIGFYDYTVILTYCSLVSAVLGMTCASRGRFTAAVLCLLVSGICDAFDGTVARTKGNRTAEEKSFGIQLDSLCDVVSFGVYPAFLCYCMGMDGVVGVMILCLYSICAVIRLAFFNVMEEKRQQTEDGSNKVYRGLPVTSISMIFPAVYFGFRFWLPGKGFTVLLHGMLLVTGFLFIQDFPVKKPDFSRLGGK